MPLKKKYDHLVKPLVIQKGPDGLYPEPRIWGGGKEWEDFQGHFSYGFLRKAGEVCHPVSGMVVHPYDEVMVCAGTHLDDILKLGGEMSIEIGQEREEHIFNSSQIICIPRGTPHGHLKVRSIEDKAIVHHFFGLAPEYKAELIPESTLPPKSSGQKYAHMVKMLRTYMDPAKRFAMIRKGMKPEDVAKFEQAYVATGQSKSGMGYETMMDERGVIHPRGYMGPGNADQLVWLFGDDLSNFNFNTLWTFCSGTGIWHRLGDGHTHPEPEVLLFCGLNPDDLLDLGAGVEFHLGPEFEGHRFKKPTAIIAPSGLIHLPEVTLWADKTWAFLVGCLSGTHEAPWVNEEDID
jgi:hypothetical protein